MPEREQGFSAPSFSERELPHSLETEQAVLGAILYEPANIAVALNKIKPDTFFEPQHRELFRLMVDLYSSERGERMDEVVVLNEALKRNIFESEAEGKRYLYALVQNVPTPEIISDYCDIIAEKYVARQIAAVARDLLKEVMNGSESAPKLLDYAEQRIYDIRQGRDVQGLRPIRDVIIDTYEFLGKLNSDERDQYIGARTGYPELDRITGGMTNSDLVVLAARPGMGKTSFALNLATNVTKETGRTVAIYSLEMSMQQLVSRMLSTAASVDSHKLRTGQLDTEEWKHLAMAAAHLGTLNIYLSEGSGISVSQMKAQLRRIRGLGMVVIDYLQLMSAPNKSDNRVQEISQITRDLKLMAKELNVPVLLLSQLNRGLEQRTDKRPLMSDLRESGSIEQDADIIMFLYNDYTYYKEKSTKPNITECIVRKNRHGEPATIDLIWDAQYTRFLPVEHSEPPPGV